MGKKVSFSADDNRIFIPKKNNDYLILNLDSKNGSYLPSENIILKKEFENVNLGDKTCIYALNGGIYYSLIAGASYFQNKENSLKSFNGQILFVSPNKKYMITSLSCLVNLENFQKEIEYNPSEITSYKYIKPHCFSPSSELLLASRNKEIAPGKKTELFVFKISSLGEVYAHIDLCFEICNAFFLTEDKIALYLTFGDNHEKVIFIISLQKEPGEEGIFRNYKLLNNYFLLPKESLISLAQNKDEISVKTGFYDEESESYCLVKTFSVNVLSNQLVKGYYYHENKFKYPLLGHAIMESRGNEIAISNKEFNFHKFQILNRNEFSQTTPLSMFDPLKNIISFRLIEKKPETMIVGFLTLERTLVIWNSSNEPDLQQTPKLIKNNIKKGSFSADFSHFVYLSEEGLVIIKSLADINFEENPFVEVPEQQNSRYEDIKFSLDKNYIILQTPTDKNGKCTYRIFELQKGKSKSLYKFLNEFPEAYAKSKNVCYLPGTSNLILMDSEYILSLKDLTAAQTIHSISREGAEIFAFSESYDKKYIICLWSDYNLVILHSQIFSEVKRILVFESIAVDELKGLRKIPQSLIYSTYNDKLFILWDDHFQVFSNILENKESLEFSSQNLLENSDSFFKATLSPIHMNFSHKTLFSPYSLTYFSNIEKLIFSQPLSVIQHELLINYLNECDEYNKTFWNYLFEFLIKELSWKATSKIQSQSTMSNGQNKDIITSYQSQVIKEENIEKNQIHNITCKILDIMKKDQKEKFYNYHKINEKSNLFKFILKTIPFDLNTFMNKFFIEINCTVKVKKEFDTERITFFFNTCYLTDNKLQEKFDTHIKSNPDDLNYSIYKKVSVSLLTPSEFLSIIPEIPSYSINNIIFTNENFILHLEFLWKNCIKIYFLKSLLGHFVFLIILCIQLLWIFPKRIAETEFSKNSYIVPSAVLDTLLLGYILMNLTLVEFANIENIKAENLLLKLKDYFSSVWNIIDMFMIFAGVVSICLDYIQMALLETELLTPLKVFNFIFFYFAWFRLLDFARGFDSTSGLIRLLAQVFRDMFGFSIVLFLTILGTALPTFLLQSTYDSTDPWGFIKIFYNILLGDFGDYKSLDETSSINSQLYFFIFFGITIFIVIIMLNLLIAIISDSFAKVMAIEKQAKEFERLQLIQEILLIIDDEHKKKYRENWEGQYLYLFERDYPESFDSKNEIVTDNIPSVIEKKINAIETKTDVLLERIKAIEAMQLENNFSEIKQMLVNLMEKNAKKEA